MRPCPRVLRNAVLPALLIAVTPLVTAAQIAPRPVARDFALYHDHNIRVGCTEFRCLGGSTASSGQDLFNETDPRGGDTGAQLFGVGATLSGGRAGFSDAPSSFLPAISVYSTSEPTTRVLNTFAGVQRYTLAAGVSSVTLNGALSFSSFGTPQVGGSGPMVPQGVVFGGIFVFQAPAGELDFGACNDFGIDPIARCFTGGVLDPPLQWPGVVQHRATFDAFNTTGDLTVSGLAEGADIFVGGWVRTISGFGGFVNASNTVRLAFSDPDVAVAAFQEETFVPVEFPVSVPEPAGPALLGLGLAVLIGSRRARRGGHPEASVAS